MDLLNLLSFQNGESVDSAGVIIIGTTMVLLFIALRRLGKDKTGKMHSANTQQSNKTHAEAVAEYEFEWEKNQEKGEVS